LSHFFVSIVVKRLIFYASYPISVVFRSLNVRGISKKTVKSITAEKKKDAVYSILFYSFVFSNCFIMKYE